MIAQEQYLVVAESASSETGPSQMGPIADRLPSATYAWIVSFGSTRRHRPAPRPSPRLAEEAAVYVAVEGGLHRASLEAVELGAGIEQIGQLDHRCADRQQRAGRQCLQVEAAGRNVLAWAAGGVTVERRLHEALLKPVKLDARIAYTGELDQGVTGGEARAGGEGEKVEAAGGDVLAHVAGFHSEAGGVQLVEQLGVDQVDLPQVGLGGVAGDAGAVLHGFAGVRVAFDTEAGDQAYGERWLLAGAWRARALTPPGPEPDCAHYRCSSRV
jgi:hypothetical protein